MRAPRFGLLFATLVTAACASAPPTLPTTPVASSLARRQMQSRVYDDCDRTKLLAAVLATLQDEGFAVRTADAALGFVSASREDFEPGTSPGLRTARWVGALFTYGATLLIKVRDDRATLLEATIRAEDLGAGQVRLRVSFLSRVRGRDGRLLQAEEIADPAVYQAFLGRVDKSLFLAREAL